MIPFGVSKAFAGTPNGLSEHHPDCACRDSGMFAIVKTIMQLGGLVPGPAVGRALVPFLSSGRTFASLSARREQQTEPELSAGSEGDKF